MLAKASLAATHYTLLLQYFCAEAEKSTKSNSQELLLLLYQPAFAARFAKVKFFFFYSLALSIVVWRSC